jgi:ankyrin repeat protein
VLRVLLDRSPELDACCNLGRTVVHYAASHGSREALKLLLDVRVCCAVCVPCVCAVCACGV